MTPDEIAELAAQKVAAALTVSDKTKITTSIKNTYKVIATIILVTAAVCTYLNKISNSQDRMESSLNYKVSIHQFETWVSALDHANRTTVPTLLVPVPQFYPSRPDDNQSPPIK